MVRRGPVCTTSTAARSSTPRARTQGSATVKGGRYPVKVRVCSFMSSFSSPPRVLCLTVRAGSVGHAVLDGFGVAEGSFFTSRLDHLAHASRFHALVRLLRSSCRQYHPTQIVLGLTGRLCAERVALAERIARRVAHLGITVTVKRLRDAAEMLVDRVCYRMCDELVSRLSKHFVPEVRPVVVHGDAQAWYWRPAWYALAIALADLLERHPLVAAALAQPSAFSLYPFREALRSALSRPPELCSPTES
jgi:hypothetical protein